ncbi:alpha-ketoglutarate-dependent dioxygenase AlkB [Roseisalinus antarcticus]|uniref:Alpha-ketoglutarate-dependent dioxygenase AlkB n=1 Tax=Roseisalinus antarcticus TaxID=254357 RepID=A0A1Y5S5I4_9RHOB|nr:alpha-ketoglutarate-dependent dioxygenase AlkB [Roseisalinus antarcticus]SLN32972.1 Alpha-ketoglutarate-dependent dioxygenase AlkB [Roseisalinus antarcticus]
MTGTAEPTLTLRGVSIYEGLLPPEAQARMVAELREVVRRAPLFSPMTPYGKPMRVRMTSAGRYGWVSDRSGYRYETRHPSGVAWPPVPPTVLAVWAAVSVVARAPECCLVNFYGDGAKMGMHQDRDEANFDFPVVSISLGDEALFRVGNRTRGGKTESVWLRSGDVAVLGGAARLLYHGVDRVVPGSSTLLPDGGRINVTLRVVDG